MAFSSRFAALARRFRSSVSGKLHPKGSKEKISPEDLIVLLVGPIGSKMEEFVGEVITGTSQQSSEVPFFEVPSSFLEVPSSSEAQSSRASSLEVPSSEVLAPSEVASLEVPQEIQLRAQTVHIGTTNKDGPQHRRVIFLTSTLFDGGKINEKSILKAVKKWLLCNRSQKPNVDRIIFFDDLRERDKYRIPLRPVGVYWRRLRHIYGTKDVKMIVGKVALVISTDEGGRGGTPKIPMEWRYLVREGARVFTFNEGSASDLADQIIRTP